jgi:hypothetical protein
MPSNTANPQEISTDELMENVTTEIGGGDPRALDGVTKDKSFRKATAELLVGAITVPEWEWFARRAINRKVDLPFLIEANERQLFKGAFEVLGTAMEGLLLQQENDFRTATADLLRGDMATDEWLDVASGVLDGLVDVPYVPAMGEDLVLDRGLDVIAQALHGLLVGSSESA